VIWWCFLFFSSTLCLQVGNRLGFWGGFSCFVSFIWCQLFACLIRAAIFHFPSALILWFSFFATGICGLFFFSLTQAFVQSLSFMAFSAIGICVRLFIFALLALVSGYRCISQFLVSCCAACCLSASSLEIWTWIFSKSVTLWTALQILLWSKPHLVFCCKVYEIALSEGLATQMGMTETQHQSQLVWIVQIWPIFASQQVDSMGTCAYSYALGCLWVVTVCCNTVSRHG